MPRKYHLHTLNDKQLDRAQDYSEHYWTDATYSELAIEDFYITYETFLRGLLAEIHSTRQGRIRKAIDFGCGNGRFSRLLTEFADQVFCYDISRDLIRQGVERFKGLDAQVTFQTADNFYSSPPGNVDLIICLGVLTTMPSAAATKHLARAFRRCLSPTGILITRDALRDHKSEIIAYESGYVGVYRNIEDYKKIFTNCGFSLRDTHMNDRKYATHTMIFGPSQPLLQKIWRALTP